MVNRQHPIKILVHVYRSVRYMIIPYTLMLFNEIKAGTGQQPYWVYVLAVVIGVSILLWSMITWWKDTYQIDESALLIQQGVFNTTHRTIPLERITNISMKATWMERIMGATTIELQTSDSNEEADATFVLTRDKADILLAEINRSVRSHGQAKPSWVLQPKDIFMRSISSNTFWMGVPLCLSIVTYIWDWIEPRSEGEEVSLVAFFKNEMWKMILNIDVVPVLLQVLGIIALCAFATWLFSLVMMQIRYNRWTVIRDGAYLHVQYGWQERKSISLHVAKIQSIRIKEHLLSRAFGYVSIWMDCVGYEGERRMKLLLPAVHRPELYTAMERLLPEFTLTMPKRNLPSGKAMYFIVLPLAMGMLVIGLGACMSIWAWLATPLLAAVYWSGRKRYAGTYWDTHGKQFVLAKPGITRTTIYVLRQAIQSIDYHQNRIQHGCGIYQVEIIINSPSKAKEYIFTGAAEGDIAKLMDWYKGQQRIEHCS